MQAFKTISLKQAIYLAQRHQEYKALQFYWIIFFTWVILAFLIFQLTWTNNLNITADLGWSLASFNN